MQAAVGARALSWLMSAGLTLVSLQVVPGSTLPSLTPKAKPGLASPAGEAPAQELAASACQSSVGCFGFLAQDDGSDEEETIKAGTMSDDAEPSSPVQRRASSNNSALGSSPSLQAESIEPRDSSRRLRESISIEPRIPRSQLGETSSSSIPEESPVVGSAGMQNSSRPSNLSGPGIPSSPFVSNSDKAGALTALPASQKQQILHHQESQQGIKPPSPQKSKKFFRWPSAPFKQSMKMFKNHMGSSTAVAA